MSPARVGRYRKGGAGRYGRGRARCQPWQRQRPADRGTGAPGRDPADRDVGLGAWILLPDGFDEHPDAKYPLVVYQDHYHAGFGPVPFVTTQPDPKIPGARRLANGYKFFEDWSSGRLPRVILIYVQNANPYYDDSYDVDSANVGPYGSAINEELIPAIEAKYRGIGQGWARFTYGGSTGGWEALAVQVFYPDQYNGCYAACPDPVDFHHYTPALPAISHPGEDI